jgi:GNAT superfamily N-acetyltransferase
MNEKLVIRNFVEEDLDHIIKRHGQIYEKEYRFDETFVDYVRKPLYEFYENFDKNFENIWIAVYEEDIAGFIALVKVDEYTAQLRWFLLEKEMRGKGIGSELMTNLIEFAKDKNYNNIYLWTVGFLDAARHLYEKFGFELMETKASTIWGKKLTEEKWNLKI